MPVQNEAGTAAQLMKVNGAPDLAPKSASRGGRRKCEATACLLRDTPGQGTPKGRADDQGSIITCQVLSCIISFNPTTPSIFRRQGNHNSER